MDWLDKKIIARLLGNSRESFRSIAREFEVTCPTIMKRVDRLRHWGVIQRFTAELSQEALGVDWVLAELRTKDKNGKTELLQKFAENKCIGEVLMLGGGRYFVFAEVCPSERKELISCINSLGNIHSIEVSEILPIRNGVIDGDCRFTTRGSKISLTRKQYQILRFLTSNARMPVNQISELTGFSAKFIRRVIRQFIECDAVNLTLRLNLPSSGKINFILKYGLNEETTGPVDATGLVTDIYPEEHWFTFYDPDAENMLHYLTAKNMKDVGHIIQEVSNLPYTDGVEAHIIYSSMKSEGRTKAYLQEVAKKVTSESNAHPLVVDNRVSVSY
ncbi:MAG: AsnC family transcriptional regulator [Candidatus Thorarchaeota archaeon]|jgi:DNA-binding Lrp family transcriptional regulator